MNFKYSNSPRICTEREKISRRQEELARKVHLSEEHARISMPSVSPLPPGKMVRNAQSMDKDNLDTTNGKHHPRSTRSAELRRQWAAETVRLSRELEDIKASANDQSPERNQDARVVWTIDSRGRHIPLLDSGEFATGPANHRQVTPRACTFEDVVRRVQAAKPTRALAPPVNAVPRRRSVMKARQSGVHLHGSPQSPCAVKSAAKTKEKDRQRKEMPSLVDNEAECLAALVGLGDEWQVDLIEDCGLSLAQPESFTQRPGIGKYGKSHKHQVSPSDVISVALNFGILWATEDLDSAISGSDFEFDAPRPTAPHKISSFAELSLSDLGMDQSDVHEDSHRDALPVTHQESPESGASAVCSLLSTHPEFKMHILNTLNRENFAPLLQHGEMAQHISNWLLHQHRKWRSEAEGQ